MGHETRSVKEEGSRKTPGAEDLARVTSTWRSKAWHLAARYPLPFFLSRSHSFCRSVVDARRNPRIFRRDESARCRFNSRYRTLAGLLRGDGARVKILFFASSRPSLLPLCHSGRMRAGGGIGPSTGCFVRRKKEREGKVRECRRKVEWVESARRFREKKPPLPTPLGLRSTLVAAIRVSRSLFTRTPMIVPTRTHNIYINIYRVCTRLYLYTRLKRYS